MRQQKNEYYFEEIIELFWLHVRMTQEEYIRSYNIFKEMIRHVVNREGSKFTIDSQFFIVTFTVPEDQEAYLNTQWCVTTTILDDFKLAVPCDNEEMKSYIKFNEEVSEIIEIERLRGLMGLLDITTGINLSHNNYGNILVEKIRCLLEFLYGLNNSVMEQQWFIKTVPNKELYKNLQQTIAEVVKNPNREKSGIHKTVRHLDTPYTIYDIFVTKETPFMISIEISV